MCIRDRHYLRRFPDSVRTLTLDAVVPPGVTLGPGIALDAQQAFEQMLQRCSDNQHCQQRYPTLGEQTRALIERLREAPTEISFENFNTGQIESMDFTLSHLTLTLRMLSYSSHGVAILPNMLFEAYTNNNFAPFARQAKMQVDSLGGALATGMYLSLIHI